MPLKSGLPSAVRGMAIEAFCAWRPARVRKKISTTLFMGLLLPFRDSVFGAGGEDLAAVGERDLGAVGIVGSVLGAVAIDHDGHAGLDHLLVDATAHQLAG